MVETLGDNVSPRLPLKAFTLVKTLVLALVLLGQVQFSFRLPVRLQILIVNRQARGQARYQYPR